MYMLVYFGEISGKKWAAHGIKLFCWFKPCTIFRGDSEDNLGVIKLPYEAMGCKMR